MDRVKEPQSVTIRMPATANLMLDAADRSGTEPSMFNFSITRPQSILNGFFNRIATTEVVLEWDLPNISAVIGNNDFTVNVGGTSTTINLPTAFMTVKQCLDALVSLLNAAATGVTFSITQTNGVTSLTGSGAFFVEGGVLAFMLGIDTDVAPATSFAIIQPDLRQWRYLDFVSPNLTYNQDLKDATTNTTSRDVLCRWYMDWEEQPQLDGYGFPILMSYTPFCARRLFNPPKQIRWDSIQPVGQLTFQVYGAASLAVQAAGQEYELPVPMWIEYPNTGYSNWLMTLQVSEN